MSAHQRAALHVVALYPMARWKAFGAYWRASGLYMTGEPFWFRAFVRLWAVVSWLRFCWFVRGLPRVEAKP